MRLPGKIAIGFVLVFAGMQVVTFDRTNPPVTADIQVASDLKSVLRRACYDCHSNETSWPWYSRVAPVSWLVHRDVAEGRETLNFSLWESLPHEERAKQQHESGEEVAEGEMPPWYYTLMHSHGALSSADKQLILTWAGQAPKGREGKHDADRD